MLFLSFFCEFLTFVSFWEGWAGGPKVKKSKIFRETISFFWKNQALLGPFLGNLGTLSHFMPIFVPLFAHFRVFYGKCFERLVMVWWFDCKSEQNDARQSKNVHLFLPKSTKRKYGLRHPMLPSGRGSSGRLKNKSLESSKSPKSFKSSKSLLITRKVTLKPRPMPPNAAQSQKLPSPMQQLSKNVPFFACKTVALL